METKYEIEDSTPIPDRQGAPERYGFGRLKVGQGFWVGTIEEIIRVRGAAYAYAVRHGVKFSTRRSNKDKDDPESPLGWRIWRVS